MSAHLAELRGERVQNLAVSSYGTAREMLMLRRADLSALRTLVIQYCENDYAENLAFVRGGGRLWVASRDEYETRVREHLDAIRYTPGKLLRRLFPLLWQGWRGFEASEPPEETRPCAMDAEAFVAVLQRLDPPPRPPAPLRVVVFEGLYGPDHRTCFLDALERRVRESALPDWIASIETLDVTAFLSAADYFPLDGHLNASGHRKVADALAARLSRAPGE
jgi:hypothetical protein